MASKNKLLGSGVKYEEDDAQEKTTVESFDVPCWMYSVTCREGKVVKSAEELKKLVAEGWKDHLGKLFLLPGHEALYEAEHKKEEAKEEEAKDNVAHIPGMKVTKGK